MLSLPPQPAIGQKRNISLENQMTAIQQAVNALESPVTRTVYATGNINTNDALILADASAGNIILSLPLAKTATPPVRVKKIDASANTVKVVAIGPDLVDNAGGTLIALQYECVTFWSDQKQGWWIVR